MSELASTAAHAAPPVGQRCVLVASTPLLLHCAAQFSTFSLSVLFASDKKVSPALPDSVQRGTAGVLLTRHCSGGPAGATSDQEGEKPARRVRGEKDDQGRPLIDADTVAFLLEIGVWSTEEEVRDKLFRASKTKRWPLGTVSAAWAFLVSVLEEPGALAAVRRQPRLLGWSADTLRKNWDVLPRVFGWTPELALRLVIESPELLTMSLGGTFVEKRAVLLHAGFSDKVFIKMVTRFPNLLTYSSEHMKATIDWLSRLGVDPVRVLSAEPPIFGLTEAHLDNKVAFVRYMGYDVPSAITKAPRLLTCGPSRLKMRFFLLLYFDVLKGCTRDAADGCALSTWAQASDKATSQRSFGKLGCFKGTAYAAMTEAERRSFETSPEFLAFRERKNAERRSSEG